MHLEDVVEDATIMLHIDVHHYLHTWICKECVQLQYFPSLN